MKSRFISASLTLFIALAAHAESDLMKDFDSLGGNDALLDQARALNPDASIRIVQDRIVNRRKRVELAPEYATVLGGDPYNKTQNIGINAHYHINPHWSLGLKWDTSFNQLRPEGEALIHDPDIAAHALIADIDYPKQEAMALVNWYPIYGKMNLFDLGVTHFDIYALAGAGTIELKSGFTSTWTAGGGVGFWISQHLSARTELRYQRYAVKHFNGEDTVQATVLGVQIGYLL